MKNNLINIEVDKLTNSIENRITGDSFDTQVLPLSENDIEKLKRGWNFDWLVEWNSKTSKVYKLIVENNTNVIQGLIMRIKS